MKLFLSYLRSKRGVIGSFFLFGGIFAAAFALYRLPVGAVVYPFALCALLGLVLLIVGFLREKHTFDALRELQRRTAETIESLPRDADWLAPEYRAVIRSLCGECVELRAEDSARYGDMVEYYTMWAHQIKTPIAAMKLSLESEDSPLSRKLSSDLFRIEQYVEMVLTFLRLDSDSTDYVFREHELDGIVRQAVRRFAPEFITRHIRLDYEPLDATVITDEKWLLFVIGQVLSNALKYTPEGSVRIYMREPKTLCIEDTGIGIAPEDLPRIFERGFTGCNGRLDKSASGIGLYLCRRICEQLGAAITAQSEPGSGTVICIDLSQYPLRAE